jgi:hypothetical protein
VPGGPADFFDKGLTRLNGSIFDRLPGVREPFKMLSNGSADGIAG